MRDLRGCEQGRNDAILVGPLPPVPKIIEGNRRPPTARWQKAIDAIQDCRTLIAKDAGSDFPTDLFEQNLGHHALIFVVQQVAMEHGHAANHRIGEIHDDVY